MIEHRTAYVPLSIRQSRLATWLWRRCPLTYTQGRRLARLLP